MSTNSTAPSSDIDDAAAVRRFSDALRALADAQKSAKGVSLYTRFVNRPFGRVLAAFAYVVGLSPDAVTILSAVTTVAGFVIMVAVPPAWWVGVVVAALLVAGFALDSADGQVARLSHRSSLRGEWLDHVIDAGKMVCLHGAVLVGVWRFVITPTGQWPGTSWLAVPLAYQATAVVLYAGLTLIALLQRIQAAQGAAPAVAATPPSLLRAVLLLPVDYGVLACTLVLWGFPPLFIAVYTALTVVNLVITAAMLPRWYRQLPG